MTAAGQECARTRVRLAEIGAFSYDRNVLYWRKIEIYRRSKCEKKDESGKSDESGGNIYDNYVTFILWV